MLLGALLAVFTNPLIVELTKVRIGVVFFGASFPGEATETVDLLAFANLPVITVIVTPPVEVTLVLASSRLLASCLFPVRSER